MTNEKVETQTATGRKNKLKLFNTQPVDRVLLILLLVVMAFGIVMLASASYYSANAEFGDGLYYLKKQLIYLAIGGIFMFLLSWLDISVFRNKWVIFSVSSLVLVLMIIPILQGGIVNGASRWIKIGGSTIQPSEFGKFVMPLLIAYFIAKFNKQMENFTSGVVPTIVILFVFCLVLGVQRNLSMLIIFACTGIVMLYFGGAKWKHLLSIFAMLLVAAVVLVIFTGFRVNRFAAFFNPWSDPSDKGYQVIQSLYAHASGGLFGTGLTLSKQKMLFLGYSETDYIYSIICEELGLIGGICVIVVFYFVFKRTMNIARTTKSRFGSLYTSAVAMILAMQTIIHIGVSCNVLPSTGQTLPFISAGGSSLIAYMMAFGIVLSVSRTTINEPKKSSG